MACLELLMQPRQHQQQAPQTAKGLIRRFRSVWALRALHARPGLAVPEATGGHTRARAGDKAHEISRDRRHGRAREGQQGPGAAHPPGLQRARRRRHDVRRRRRRLRAHHAGHDRPSAGSRPPPPPPHRHRGLLEVDTQLDVEEVYERMCHPAPDSYHILHDLVVHPLRRRLLLADLQPSRHKCIRSGFCHFYHLHLPRRRVHVVVAGRLPPWPRRILHQEDAAGPPYLLCFQADKRRNIARPELAGIQGGGDHTAPKDRRVCAGVHHVDGDPARRERRPGARLRLRADESPLPRRHLPHEPRRRDHTGPVRPGGHRDRSLRRHVGAADYIRCGGDRRQWRPCSSSEGSLG